MGTKKGNVRVGAKGVKGARLAYDALPKKKTTHKNSWADSVKKARKALKITGFQPIKKGGALYKKAKEIHDKH